MLTKAILYSGNETIRLRRLIREMIMAFCFSGSLSGCTYEVEGTPTYENSGVARLYDYPRERGYQTLGMHSWGFYRPSFSEPTLADVWGALSEKVQALAGCGKSRMVTSFSVLA